MFTDISKFTWVHHTLPAVDRRLVSLHFPFDYENHFFYEVNFVFRCYLFLFRFVSVNLQKFPLVIFFGVDSRKRDSFENRCVWKSTFEFFIFILRIKFVGSRSGMNFQVNDHISICFIFGFGRKFSRWMIIYSFCWNSVWYQGESYIDFFLNFGLFTNPFLSFLIKGHNIWA